MYRRVLYGIILAMAFQERGEVAEVQGEFEINYQFSNLYQITSPRIAELGEILCIDRIGGANFHDELHEVGALMGEILSTGGEESEHEPTLIIGIPRGGTPLAEGVRDAFSSAELVITNDGKNADPNKSLLEIDESLGNTKLIFVVDSVVDLGSTAERTIRAVYSKFPDSTIRVISLISSVDGAFRLERMFPRLRHYTAILEKETRWIPVDKNVNHRIIPKIGDVGELVSQI